MIQFTFKKPPKAAIICYCIGFSVIALTMSHQLLNGNWISIKTNQQAFILGALVVALGSVLNWVLPYLNRNTSEEP